MDALVGKTTLAQAVADPSSLRALVLERKDPLREFLTWAMTREASGPAISLRLEHRADIHRCRGVLNLFFEPWWGVVVYSCFDSETGARIAASALPKPLPRLDAERAIARLDFPHGSVQHHRAQATLTRATASLIAASGQPEGLREVLQQHGLTFDERFNRLQEIRPPGWGRTTCFDVLLRAGALDVGPEPYGPDKAYLKDSTGPAAGFKRIWGEEVASSNAQLCEQLLQRWTKEWYTIVDLVDARWDGVPYASGDFENALCVFQEGRNASPT